MRIKYLYLTVLFLVIACSSPVNRNDALIGFAKEKHDFGKIPYKKETAYIFDFCNKGKTPLIIYEVKASCGCTVPEWNKEPIRPGGKGVLKIKYDTSFPGIFHKTLEVFYNGAGSPARIEIQGEVQYPEE